MEPNMINYMMLGFNVGRKNQVFSMSSMAKHSARYGNKRKVCPQWLLLKKGPVNCLIYYHIFL